MQTVISFGVGILQPFMMEMIHQTRQKLQMLKWIVMVVFIFVVAFQINRFTGALAVTIATTRGIAAVSVYTNGWSWMNRC